MEAVLLLLLLCAVVSINGQYMSPGLQGWGMGPGLGNQIYRPPGWLQSSQLNTMTYPSWRNHPLFRMAGNEKPAGTPVFQDILNIPKVPATQEVLTHMALANQNPMPLYDTIADMLYEPQKARQAVVNPVYLQGMNQMRANYPDDCGPERGLGEWLY